MKRLPENKEEADKIEEAFAEDMARLSLDELEQIMFDVHGLSEKQVDEEVNFVNVQLSQMEKELTAIKNRTAFEAARRVNAEYVNGRPLRLMFLRSTQFNAKEAAELIVSHFHMKRELFKDDEVLGRDIRMSDLTLEEMEVLKAGNIQLLPERDAAGRTIAWAGSLVKELKAPEIHGRVFWYFIMTTQRDTDVQRNGTVFVYHNYWKFHQGTPFRMRMAEIYSALPLRVVTFHYCADYETAQPYGAGIRMSLHPYERRRFRSHQGTPEETEFALQTYGIPTSHLPPLRDGTLKLAFHHQWLETQREREQKETMNREGAPTETILVPRRVDVLFGRGKYTREHVGNLRLVNLCEAQVTAYNAANKQTKTDISNSLVLAVHESNGRFLKWIKNEGWTEVDDLDAREKVSHFFRHLRSKSSTSQSRRRATKKRSLPEDDPLWLTGPPGTTPRTLLPGEDDIGLTEI